MKESLRGKLTQRSKQEGECVVWTGYRLAQGYGQVGFRGRLLRVHRVAWELANGPIPSGLCILHACDNPPCIRLDHLFIGTLNDNNQDMRRKGRQARGDKHGMRTHPERRSYGERNGSRLHPDRRARGERNGGAKLTEKQAKRIRVISAQKKLSQTVIGKAFGVSHSQVSRIVNNKSWKRINKSGATVEASR